LALPLLGLVYTLTPLAVPGETARDAVQNVTEWWVASVFTLFFVVLAWAWRSTGFHGAFETRRAPQRGDREDENAPR
jgi:hypothetical protein